MKKIFNLDQLVSITVKGKEEHWWEYQKHSPGLFGLFETKEGFYSLGEFMGNEYSLIKKWSHIMVENNKLYYKPKVVLRFVDGSETIKRFDTFALANKWAYEIASKNITSKIEIKD